MTKLRLERLKQSLTQQELAEKAGVRWVTISRIERGKNTPYSSTIKKIAAALGVKPEDII